MGGLNWLDFSRRHIQQLPHTWPQFLISAPPTVMRKPIIEHVYMHHGQGQGQSLPLLLRLLRLLNHVVAVLDALKTTNEPEKKSKSKELKTAWACSQTGKPSQRQTLTTSSCPFVLRPPQKEDEEENRILQDLHFQRNDDKHRRRLLAPRDE